MDHTKDRPKVLTDSSIEGDAPFVPVDSRPHSQGLLFHATTSEHPSPQLKVVMPDEPEEAHLALVADEESEEFTSAPFTDAAAEADQCDSAIAVESSDGDQFPTGVSLEMTADGDDPANALDLTPAPVVPAVAVARAPADFLDWAAQQSAKLTDPEAGPVLAVQPSTQPASPRRDRWPVAPPTIGAGRLFSRGIRAAAALVGAAHAAAQPLPPFRWYRMWRMAGLTTLGGMALYAMVRSVLS